MRNVKTSKGEEIVQKSKGDARAAYAKIKEHYSGHSAKAATTSEKHYKAFTTYVMK